MSVLIQKFKQDESGATAIEYGLIAAIVGVGIIGSLELIAPAFNARLFNITTYF
ncbi:MAG: Flp family type IVb pilin [Pseudomonadota bacterium]